ncbi:MAG: hypothetical protein RR225_03850 [Clostridium sp.]
MMRDAWKKIIKGALLACLCGGIFISTATPVMAEQTGWLQENGAWYYYDNQGAKRTGWIEDRGKLYYLYEDGHCAMNEITPDGHRVDASGAWYEVRQNILGKQIAVPTGYVPPASVGSQWGNMKPDIDQLAALISKDVGTTRRMTVGVDAIEYLDIKTGDILLGFYKDVKNNAYRLDLHIRFDKSSTDKAAAATYDYAVLKGILCKISGTPDILCDSIYSAWQEENTYSINRMGWTVIGDCSVRYEAEAGYGKYYISMAGR